MDMTFEQFSAVLPDVVKLMRKIEDYGRWKGEVGEDMTEHVEVVRRFLQAIGEDEFKQIMEG